MRELAWDAVEELSDTSRSIITMADPVTDKIVRSSDGDAIKAMLTIAQSDLEITWASITISPVAGSALTFQSKEFNSSELKDLTKLKGRTFRSISLASGRGCSVAVVRDFNRNNTTVFDTLTMSPGGSTPKQISGLEFAKLGEAVQQAFAITAASDLATFVGANTAQHFQAREEALNRLESLASRLISDVDDKRQKLEEDYETKRNELEADFEERNKQTGETLKLKQEEIDAEALALATRKQELDDRTNTHARRDIRDTLLKEIKDVKRFSISSPTQWRRYWVIAVYFVLLAFFGVPSLNWLVRGTDPPSSDPAYWFLLGKQIACGIGFVLTAGFFLRWLNAFAAKSTDEEFKLKQLQLDIDRASWLVELYFESKANGGENEAGLPSELMACLSQNLFAASDDAKHEAMTAGDALASSILGTAAKVNLQLPGATVDIDKKGIRSLGKQSI
jgi:hypothetical protein